MNTATLSAGCAVLTLSDTRTADTDTSGQTLQTLLQAAGHRVVDYRIEPDEPARLAATLEAWCDQPEIQAILITGSTGVSPRDIAPEVVEPRFTKALPGFGELFRMLSWQQVGSRALGSRATAGLINQTLVFVMPGSTRAVSLAMEQLILPELPHLLRLMAGGGHG